MTRVTGSQTCGVQKWSSSVPLGKSRRPQKSTLPFGNRCVWIAAFGSGKTSLHSPTTAGLPKEARSGCTASDCKDVGTRFDRRDKEATSLRYDEFCGTRQIIDDCTDRASSRLRRADDVHNLRPSGLSDDCFGADELR